MLKKRKFQIIFISLFICCPSGGGAANGDVSQNDKIKAVFIYNFTKYIQWPAADTSKVFTIGVFGQSNILIPLREIARKRLVDGREIITKQFSSLDSIEKCHVLFIPAREGGAVNDILNQVRYKNILTVGEDEGFAHAGGIINFAPAEGKMKFEMNLNALRRAGLQAGSELLKLAVIIDEIRQNK